MMHDLLICVVRHLFYVANKNAWYLVKRWFHCNHKVKWKPVIPHQSITTLFESRDLPSISKEALLPVLIFNQTNKTENIQIQHLGRGLLELGKVFGTSGLTIILDNTSITLDKVHSGETSRIQIVLNKVTFLVTSELVNRHTSRCSILLKLLFHTLTELTPGCVYGNNSLLVSLDKFQCFIIRGNFLNGTRLPKVAIKCLFGTSNVNTTLGLGRSILVGKTNETSLTLRGVVEPGGLISLEFEVDEFGGSVLWDGDCVLGITVML